MRKLSMAFLFCLASSIANAATFQSSKNVICDEQQVILDTLLSKYEEKVIWMGKDAQDGTAYILTSNEKSSTWTYLQTNGSIACVLGVGTKTTLIFGEKI